MAFAKILSSDLGDPLANTKLVSTLEKFTLKRFLRKRQNPS